MVTNFKNTRENPTDAWNYYGEGTHNVKFWYKCFTILWPYIQRHCATVLNLILVPVKEHLHGRAFGMNDNLKGGLLFENEIRNAYGWALRIEKPSRIEV